ncbi:hypothetical protein Mapa_018838 [Marchantia paleacea]|nr:hypothetical protein Mapa_018838 [Marchantia paleacea]
MNLSESKFNRPFCINTSCFKWICMSHSCIGVHIFLQVFLQKVLIPQLDIVYPYMEYQFHKQSYHIGLKILLKIFLKDYLP